MRWNRISALAGLIVSASMAHAIEVYRNNGDGTYTRIQVSWAIPENPLRPTLNPRVGGQAGTIVTGLSSSGPMDDAEVVVGANEFGASEFDGQAGGVYTAVAELPAADGYVIVFTYELNTWDSYNDEFTPGSSGADYFDFFSININQDDYYLELVEGVVGMTGLTDPLIEPDPNGTPVVFVGPGTLGGLPGVTWGFGGFDYADGALESASGRTCIEIEGDSQETYYLSATLDTATQPTANGILPSWGIFNNFDLCPGDFNVDGVVDAQDYSDFDADFKAGKLTADWDKDGELTFNDFLEFQNDYALGCD